MVSITIRNLDDDLKTRLRVRAAEHHRSMEEEVRIILRDTVNGGRAAPRDLAKFTRECFLPLGGVELQCTSLRIFPEQPPILVLDTNVASELMRPEPKPTVAAWISDRDAEELYLTAVSEAELLYGVAIMPTGRRRNALKAAMSRWLDLGFADRILPFDSSAARAYAVIASRRRHAGRPLAACGFSGFLLTTPIFGAE